MSVWDRGSLMTNPYYRTAFRVSRVPRETTRRRTVVQLIGATRRVLSADPGAHTIGGVSVTLSELNTAEQIMLDPPRRMVEELLHHATERPDAEPLRRLAESIAQAMAPQEGERESVVRLEALRSWILRLVKRHVEGDPVSDPSFGPLELRIDPPFGPLEEEG